MREINSDKNIFYSETKKQQLFKNELIKQSKATIIEK